MISRKIFLINNFQEVFCETLFNLIALEMRNQELKPNVAIVTQDPVIHLLVSV